jgi:hypothetical protein
VVGVHPWLISISSRSGWCASVTDIDIVTRWLVWNRDWYRYPHDMVGVEPLLKSISSRVGWCGTMTDIDIVKRWLLCTRDWYWYRYELVVMHPWLISISSRGGWCATVTDIDIITGNWYGTIFFVSITYKIKLYLLVVWFSLWCLTPLSTIW